MPFSYPFVPLSGEEYAALQVAYDEDEDEDEEEDEDDEEDEDEYGHGEEEEEREVRVYIDVTDSPRVLQSEDGKEQNYRRLERGETVCSTSGSQESGQRNRGENEGLFCPICMEAWTSGGEHHVWYPRIQ